MCAKYITNPTASCRCLFGLYVLFRPHLKAGIFKLFPFVLLLDKICNCFSKTGLGFAVISASRPLLSTRYTLGSKSMVNAPSVDGIYHPLVL